MKTRFALLFLGSFLTIHLAAAYNPYSVTVTGSKTYDPLPASPAILAAANTALTPTTETIGFNFRYFGQMQDKVTINQNGQISFTDFKFPDMIDAICATLQPTATSQIACGISGTAPARKFIIEWKNMNIKNANSTSANTTFHIELFEGTGEVSMMYNLAPAGNDQNWYNGDHYGLAQEFKNIQGDYDLIIGTNMTTPKITNVAGSSIIRYGYGNSFPATGTEFAFNYIKPSGAPFITIISPKTGTTVGHTPIPIWWNSTDADMVTISFNAGGSLQTIAQHVLSGKTPYYWTPVFSYGIFSLIVQDEGSSVKGTTGDMTLDVNGINYASFNTQGINLYPNPCTEKTNISLEKYAGNLIKGNLCITNTLGQVVYSLNLDERNADIISVSDLKKGFYIINLRINNKFYTDKLVVN